ncbi:TniQ family protein [Bradyrhizobium iriomotense]|uniref:TniQ family protein n=1 Tax=Bradyrhizobium iriomotense TaxID=441950 RepID=UPI0024E0EFCC|nr:TniQ family protein [Bradyrhizobium iriomotense]
MNSTTSERAAGRPNHPPLSARVVLFPDEPAYGLAQRLARRNGVNSLASFCADMGISAADLINGRAADRIAALARADLDSLERVTVRAEQDQQIRLGGEFLKQDQWSFRSLRVCPECLREDLKGTGHPDYRAHKRSWWNLTFIHACPFHGTFLVTRSPADIRNSLDPEVLDVRYAGGGNCDLALVPIDGRRLTDIRPEKYFLGRLGFMPRSNHETLDALSLGQAVELLDRIGTAAVGGVHPDEYCSVFLSRDVLVAGYTILGGGRPALARLFLKLKADLGAAESQWIPRARYGPLYAWLFHVSTRDIDAFEPIRRIFLECIGSPTPSDLVTLQP